MDSVKTMYEENEGLQKELIRLARKSKRKRVFIVLGVMLLIVVAAILAAWLFGRSQGKNVAETEIEELKLKIEEKEEEIRKLNETPFVANPVAPEIIMDLIDSEIKDIGELATVEYLFTDAAKFSDSKQIKDWNIPFTEKSFVLKWNGVIKAGVKLDEVIIEVNEVAKTIIITVPSAEILSYEIDNESVEVLDEKDNIFNNITVSDKIKFDETTEEAMKKRAIENGLLLQAQKNAEDTLAVLIKTNPTVGNTYELTFVVKS